MAVGDYLILQNGTRRTTRYRIVNLLYHLDPPDMWQVEAVFAPRRSP